MTWKASGGALTQQDDSATLDTSGLDPGRYSVMVEVSDGEKIASCSEDITVEKRKNYLPLRKEDNLRLGRFVLWGEMELKMQFDIFRSDMIVGARRRKS